MKIVIQFFLILGIALALKSCSENQFIDIEPSNTTISTRFINSDSISQLNTIVDSLNTQITLLDSTNRAINTQINALGIRINLEPENDSIDIFRDMVEELEMLRVLISDSLTIVRSNNSDFGSKRDSLNSGFSFINQIRNIDNGQTDILDSLLTDYELPLPFNEDNASFEITINNRPFDIQIEYFLVESIDIEGNVTLPAENIMISLPDFNTFDSLIVENESLYIFHY